MYCSPTNGMCLAYDDPQVFGVADVLLVTDFIDNDTTLLAEEITSLSQ